MNANLCPHVCIFTSLFLLWIGHYVSVPLDCGNTYQPPRHAMHRKDFNMCLKPHAAVQVKVFFLSRIDITWQGNSLFANLKTD